jgi:AraC-like DNA-binding protein
MVMVPSGSLAQFEALLGNPPWFREGTSLEPTTIPFPQQIALADDFRIIANIYRHGAVARVLAAIITAPRAPHSRGWNAAIGVAPTLGDALELMVPQFSDYNPYLEVQFGRRDGLAVLKARIAPFVPEAARPLICMGTLLLICRHLNPYGLEAMQACTLQSAACPDSELLALQGLMAIRLQFGADDYWLSFPESWLARRNPDADPDLWQLQVNMLAGCHRPTAPLVRQINDAVRACLEKAERPPRLADMALRLGLSERTLVRRLTDAGDSYSGLIDAERRALAARLIIDSTISLQRIADQLAYGDRQGFGRAFRGWFGESPGRYRRRLLSL